jgi:hypothetical protein
MTAARDGKRGELRYYRCTMKLRRVSVGALVAFPALAALLYACGGDDTTQPPGTDAGPDVTVDATADAKTDAKADGAADSGTDSGLTGTSKQIQDVRNLAVPTVVVDAGSDASSDATTEASVSDAAVEGGSDGGGGIPVNNLPIDNAIVTYVKPAVGTDPAGFFIQAEKTGPAIFVAVDPTTLNPVPVAGDDVSFKVTSVLNVSSLREVVGLSGWTRNAQGKDLTALLQDVSTAANLVTALDSYESEYIKLTGTTAGTFGAAGTGSVSAQITTNGIGSPSTSFRIRLPATVQDSIDMSINCSFTLTGAMWRFTTQAQVSGWANGDISGMVCPTPTVVSAAATGLTTVVVTFDRKVDTNSLVLNGSQFAMNNGLTVSAAALTGPREVTLTTSAQTPLQAYTVTVANTIKDLQGKVLGNPNTANFIGYVVPAVVRLNELSPALTGGVDLIELRVVTAGNVNGITIEEYLNNTKATLATLPLLQVAVDDLIVVHLTPGVGITDELVTKGTCIDALCYPNAYDVKGTTNDLTNNARVVLARSPANGAIQDGIAYYRSSGATPSVNYFKDVNTLAAANHWVGCNGTCADTTASLPVSVDFVGVSSTVPSGNSVARISNTDTNAKADWAVGASTFGAPNP